MLQGRHGAPPVSGSLTLGLRAEPSRMDQNLLGLHPEPSRTEQAMTLAAAATAAAVAEMEHPQDMARQALAATGGKSNLKATQWLLERRAEVQQHHLDADIVNEPLPPSILTQRRGNNLDGPGLRGQDEGEELTPMLQSSPVLWGSNIPAGDGRILPASAFGGVPADCAAVKRVNSHPGSMDWLASNRPVERHASVGSSAPYVREDMTDGQLQLKLQPALEHQESIKAFKLSYSPEPEDYVKLNVSKPSPLRTAVAPSLQDVGGLKRKRQDEADAEKPLPATAGTSSPIAVGLKQQSQPTGKTPASLAERMRPNSVAEILGQEHLLGPHCVLRSLLDGENLPCIIFGGPPGTGKTSLARLIARSASCRFVALSSAKGGSFEVQEILDEAKQAKKFGQRTVLFVETLSRLNKSQQESLLPAIEAGYVVFIGATTENSSAEVIPSLYMRCRVFTLRKLQHDHLCTAMKRAISDRERGVQVSLCDAAGLEVLAIEDEVIQFLANTADGDARVALNALEAAVYIALGKLKQRRKSVLDGKAITVMEADEAAFKDREKPLGSTNVAKRDTLHNVLEHLKGYFQFTQEEYAKPFKKIVGGKEVSYGIGRDKEQQRLGTDVDKEGASAGTAAAREGMDLAERRAGNGDLTAKGTAQVDIKTALVVTMVDAREAFQWPQAFIEKLQEENDVDLLLVLLRTIKGGDSNAAVYWLARLLEKGEEPQKVASSLTKFASDEIGMADPHALVQAVACHQACQLMDWKDCTSHLTQCVVYLSRSPKSDALPQAYQLAHRTVQDGQNEPVPSHLRSAASTKESCYLPTSLRNIKLLQWPEPS